MDKQAQRLAGIAARNAISPALRADYCAAILRRIEESPAFRRARYVLSYHAFSGEADISGLNTTDKVIAYPRCESQTAMRAYVPSSGALIRGIYGIEEPDPARSIPLSPADIDLVLTPCAAFDAAGFRIGMGGGYYDRYLPQCKKAVVMIVAFDTQKMPAITGEAHDVRCDYAVTERALYRCQS